MQLSIPWAVSRRKLPSLDRWVHLVVDLRPSAAWNRPVLTSSRWCPINILSDTAMQLFEVFQGAFDITINAGLS